MRKKLLAGILALALCSTNMPPQTIFAEEFTSGNPDVVSEEETPEIFTNEEQEAVGETDEELSVFSSEEVPEFNDAPDEAMAAAENEQAGEIDLADNDKVMNGVYTISSAGDYKFTCSRETGNRIVVDGKKISAKDSINIYLNKVNINTSAGPALQINVNVEATVTIYLTGTNNLITTNENSAGLQKDNEAQLIITSASNTSIGTLNARNNSNLAYGAGIGGGYIWADGRENTCSGANGSNIHISNSSVNAKSTYGAGIGGGYIRANERESTYIGANGSDIYISDSSVNAESTYGAGIGGGYIWADGRENTCSGANGSNIHISNSSVNAKSTYGAGIGGGYIRVSGLMNTCSGANSSYIQISNSSVNAKPTHRDSIGGGYISNVGSKNTCSGANSSYIQISGGSVNASLSKSNCPQNTQKDNVYLCIIDNPEFSKVQVDNLPWTPVNHPNDPKLYAWLTGEDHVITVGENETSYIFDSESKTFSCNKRKITAGIFKFDGSHEFTYDGNSKKPSIAPIDTCKGVGTIAVNYYNKRDEYITEPKDVGTYTIKIDVEEGDFYEAISDLTNEDWKFEITSGTLTPTITKYTGTYDGGPHSVIKIDKDTIPPNSEIKYSVDNITWIILNSSNPNEGIPTVRTVKEAENTKIYIRISNTNYNEWISKEYKAIIRPATSTPGFPSDTEISVPWSCKKVEDVKDCLGNNWKWRDSDISKELPVGKEISATAVYNGTDAGNYLNESVEFKITRKECEHKNTVGRYYSSPSCTSSGYSGDTYCNDCKRTIYYGSTIPAYGHDYDNGVITTEPTTETDGIITYTCKRCKHQDTKNLGKLGDGEPYIEGSFQKKGWDTVNDLIKTSKEKDTISIIMNGARTLPASVLSGIKGKDISLNLDMENGFIWKINGTSITAETPADTDLSVTNTAEYIPAALYSLISTNQNDFGFHLGRNGTFDFPAVLSVKADASCAGLMANLFWYDVENGVLQCIQTVTVGGAFEDSIPYADFTLSKGQDYFIAFGTESLNGRVIHTDGSITDENGAYLRPADTKISSYSIDRNKLTVKLAKGCAGAQGYDFVISRKSDMLKTGKFSKTVSSTGKPQASFRYLAKGTWYVAARSWVLDAQGNKVYGSWTKVKKIKITVVTPQQPKIRDITVKGNTVTVTYTKCKNATGYEILLGTKYKISAGEKYPIKKYVKRTEGKNTVTVTFTNVKKGTWYVTVRSWNRTSKNKSRVYSPYSTMKKFAV